MTGPEFDYDRLGGDFETVVEARLRADASGLASVRGALGEPPEPRARPWVPVLVAAGLTAAVIGSWWWTRRAVDAQRVDVVAPDVAGWIAAYSEERALELTDGTQVVLRRGSRARLEGDPGAERTLRLGAGVVEVSVPDGAEPWRFVAGPYVLTTTAAAFVLTWDPDSAQLDVVASRGRVELQYGSASAPRWIEAGQRAFGSAAEIAVRDRGESAPLRTVASVAEPRGSAEPREPSTALDHRDPTPDGAATRGPEPRDEAPGGVPGETSPTSPAPSDEVRDAPDEIRDAPDPERARPSGARRREPWKRAARARDYATAFSLAKPQLDHLLARESADDLFLLADVARFAGKSSIAERVLLTFRERFSRHPDAATAAYTLGLVVGAKRGRKHKLAAAAWFQTACQERPAGKLHRSALGRQMLAYRAAGASDRLRATAEHYLRVYPDGPHAEAARRAVAP